ncbi:hypothetical protein P8452_72012 [Trifolium repens]|nr:hypothetical protein P8452_72012 [Trifolium repens]
MVKKRFRFIIDSQFPTITLSIDQLGFLFIHFIYFYLVAATATVFCIACLLFIPLLGIGNFKLLNRD